MKLKYRLFLSIFPLSLLLLAIPYFYVSRGQGSDNHARLENLFTGAAAGLSELKSHQEDSLKLTAEVLAQDPSWGAITLSNEKDLLPQTLAGLRKRSAIDLLFFASSDGQIQSAAFNSDRFALDDVKNGATGFFERGGQLRKKTGLLALDDKPYLAAITPVTLNGQTGYLGMAVLFPLIGYLHNASGFDSALSGKSGKWAASVNLSPEDTLKLTNLSSEETSEVSLSGTKFYARLVKFDPDSPNSRLALLAPEANALPGGNADTSSFFLFCALIAAVAATGITWYLSHSISRPLLLVAKAVQEMTGNNSPTEAPASITERNDEVGTVAISFNVLASSFGNELRQKEKALGKLEKYQAQLLELNHRMAKKLYENRVMLSLWKEQEKSEDTKDFLSHILEEILQGLPFHYGCIIIRPLAQIGPEVILARIERNQNGGKDGISVTDILERSDRTLWLSSLSPELKEFLLRMNQEGSNELRLLQDTISASIEPDGPVKRLGVVSIRLAQGSQHMGSLHLITEKERFVLTPPEEEFLSSVAAQMSVALDNRSLQYANRVDPLTRLYNRGYMNDRLREEMLRTSRTNRPFTMMLLDIDHFKKVNDTHGHPAGDEILVGLAALLKRSCRASDAICRYGGEEIALLLVDTPLTGAKIFAENIRKTIENESFSIPDGKSLRITASMGLAEFPSQAASMGELIKHADDALYKAKREGRNSWRAFSA